MKIEKIALNKVQNIKLSTQKTFVKKTISSQSKAMTKAASVGIVASAIGLIFAKKSEEKFQQERRENYDKLKSLEMNDDTVNKILSKTDKKGKPIFNSKNIDILEKAAGLEDKTFFYHIMKNIDNIESLEKQRGNSYKTIMKTPDGVSDAILSIKKDHIITDILEKKDDGRIISSQKGSANGYWEESTIVLKNKKTMVNELIRYDSDSDTISRIEYDKNDDKKIVSYQITKISTEGVINDKTLKKYFENGDFKVKDENVDYKHNNAKTVANSSGSYDEVKELVRTVKNPLTGKIEIQKMTLSDVKGVYNSVIIDENGNEKVESLGRVNPDGSTYVEKNLESLDGVKTHYVREASKNEDNIKTFYQITDNDGKVLTTVDRTFKRISPTKAYSSINGHGYSIEKREDSYEVVDLLSNRKVVMRNKDLFKNKSSLAHPEMLDKMSGDMLIDMYDRDYRYKYVSSALDSVTRIGYQIIESADDMFAFAHEQGHTRQYPIIYNPKFVSEYSKEKSAFENAFPSLQQNYIDYFLNQFNICGRVKGGMKEVVAETNAIYSTASGMDELAMRTYYLQKYFPRTIAVSSYLLNPNSNLYLTDQ